MGTKKRIDWDAQPLGKVGDSAIAATVGCTPTAVYFARKARGISSPSKPHRPPCDPSVFRDELGKDHDRVIAERHGLHWQQVAVARRRLGVSGARRNWDAMEDLGTAPDIVLARKYGVDNKTVAQARWRRGIPKWQEARTCPCGDTYVAFHLEQKFCSYRCQRYHWHLVNKLGREPEIADLAVALAAYRRTLKKKGTGLCGKTPTTS